MEILCIEVLKCSINTHEAEFLNIVNIIFAGRRIEVKIITAGYYENEEGNDFHTLSDEETSQFQNMIMALLVNRNMSFISFHFFLFVRFIFLLLLHNVK